MEQTQNLDIPGLRFVPSDQELIEHYLTPKVNGQPIRISKMHDVQLYERSPMDLTASYPKLGDEDWYLFTPRDRKYLNGKRPNRSVAGIGFWKATGAEREIRCSQGKVIGKKQVLVFYEGKPKSGETKTKWIMHEYMLPSRDPNPSSSNMRLDDWVLCRVYEKRSRKRKTVDDNMITPAGTHLPAGFRFVPTEEELITNYLIPKVKYEKIPVSDMHEVNLYGFSPMDLTAKYGQVGDKKWYFFSSRDRKYPKGKRPKRSVDEVGLWKATGAEREIRCSQGKVIGKKQVLVFYNGKPKSKTNWMMHEYKLPPSSEEQKPSGTNMRLDDCVLCRVYEKPSKKGKEVAYDPGPTVAVAVADNPDLTVDDYDVLDPTEYEFKIVGTPDHLFPDYQNGDIDGSRFMASLLTENNTAGNGTSWQNDISPLSGEMGSEQQQMNMDPWNVYHQQQPYGQQQWNQDPSTSQINEAAVFYPRYDEDATLNSTENHFWSLGRNGGGDQLIPQQDPCTLQINDLFYPDQLMCDVDGMPNMPTTGFWSQGDQGGPSQGGNIGPSQVDQLIPQQDPCTPQINEEYDQLMYHVDGMPNLPTTGFWSQGDQGGPSQGDNIGPSQGDQLIPQQDPCTPPQINEGFYTEYDQLMYDVYGMPNSPTTGLWSQRDQGGPSQGGNIGPSQGGNLDPSHGDQGWAIPGFDQ